MVLNHLVLIIMVCSTVSSHRSQDEQCSPPLGDVCVDISRCPKFADILKQPIISISPNVLKMLTDHRCGVGGNTVKVCCASKTVARDDNTVPPVPPNVTAHRNIRQLTSQRCGPIAVQSRITGGRQAFPAEYPWMALLGYASDDGGVDFRCAGTLINRKYILTAAHCVGDTMTVSKIRLGAHKMDVTADCIGQACSQMIQDIVPEKITVHPDYVAKIFQNDIAIIKLTKPANTLQDNIQPICLPIGDLALKDMTWKKLSVCGWGMSGRDEHSNILRGTKLPVIPTATCRKKYARYNISHRQICAGGYRGRDSCSGDSGGPLQDIGTFFGEERYIQHGIVSFGPKICGVNDHPGIYTNIAYYMDWILDNLEED